MGKIAYPPMRQMALGFKRKGSYTKHMTPYKNCRVLWSFDER